MGTEAMKVIRTLPNQDMDAIKQIKDELFCFNVPNVTIRQQ